MISIWRNRKRRKQLPRQKADEESRKETEKIRQVFEQKDAADKYDNSKISQKAMSVKTGDKANAGGMLVVAGVAGMIAALAQKIKKKRAGLNRYALFLRSSEHYFR